MLKVLEGPTIEQGESLSDGIDCSAGQLVRITMPFTYEPEDSVLTFQFSTDGNFYNEMYGIDGHPIKIAYVVPNAGVVIPEHIGRAVAWLKIRSGFEGEPIVQKERRTFAVTILTSGWTEPASFKFKPKRAAKKKAAKKKARR